jgi:hypothetical protein
MLVQWSGRSADWHAFVDENVALLMSSDSLFPLSDPIRAVSFSERCFLKDPGSRKLSKINTNVALVSSIAL